MNEKGVRLPAELERSRVVRIQPGNLSATMQDLIGALERFRQVLESGNGEERNAIVRAFPGNPGGKDHEAGDPEMVSPASTVSLKMVELRGVELKGSIVIGATEDELLALPSSGRGRR